MEGVEGYGTGGVGAQGAGVTSSRFGYWKMTRGVYSGGGVGLRHLQR